MNAIDTFRAIQGAMGLPEDAQDGIPGPHTAAAFAAAEAAARAELLRARDPSQGTGILTGSPGWRFSARIVGDDVLLENVTATWFGGVNDPLDNGDTSSGISTRSPGVLGCALPVVPGHPSTKGSPIAFPAPGLKPGIPWKTPVEFSRGEITVTVPLIDNGPAKSAGDAADLTQAAFRALAPNVSLKVGVLRGVMVRIIGAAKFARLA